MEDLNDICILWLDYFEELTYKKKADLLSLFPTAKDLFENFKVAKDKILSVIGEDIYNKMAKTNSVKSIENYLERICKIGIKFVTIYDDRYPKTLKNIDMPPFVLYYKGNFDLVDSLSIAIVGTRKPTIYGKTATEDFAQKLSNAGFCIVSGLALGVDTIAHETTIKNNGKTIAVLAGGLDNIYPSVNFSLSKEIEKNGLLLSEYRPGIEPESWHFPIRNRIIAGLSKGVLITEAGLKSGSIHTKNYALDFGRDVFAVPGNIFSAQSLGCNEMIKNGQAKLVTEIDDILEEYNLVYTATEEEPDKEFSDDEKLVMKLLSEKELSYQEIVNKTKIDAKTLNSLLTTMAIRGIIKKLAGNYYCLVYRKEV